MPISALLIMPKTAWDIVYVELAEEDLVLQQGDVLCAVESVKTAAEVYMPVKAELLKLIMNWKMLLKTE